MKSDIRDDKFADLLINLRLKLPLRGGRQVLKKEVAEEAGRPFNVLLPIPVQKPDAVHRDVYGAEILLHLSLQDVGPRSVQQMAVSVIYRGEEDGLIDAGGVLEGDEFHGIAVFGVVVFNGEFLIGEKDYIQEPSITESGAMLEPEFIVRFSEIMKAGRPGLPLH